ncbi:MAG: type II toxin-antitoxin system VapB family antitoxin [Chitinispirillaceae bacterium]|nr:type II toxin-antitoxin system VapB family antitoxin [Chitinispirillaceae bacterium]
MKRTNIELDEKLVDAGKKLTGLKTSKDLVNFALTQLVRREKQKRILKLEGNIGWSGDLAEMRAARGVD